MKNLIHFLLKYSWTIREYSDKKGNKLHKFNLFNPIGYVMLILFAMLGGVWEFFKTFYSIISQTIKEAIYDN